VHQRQLRRREEFLEHGGPLAGAPTRATSSPARSTGSRSSPPRTAMRWA
jgi:hypothetical protein